MKVLGSTYFIFLFSIIFIYLLIQYWKSLKSATLFYKSILISLRSSVLIILILLLVDPWFAYDKKISESQKIDIILDSSESMFMHFEENSSSYFKTIDKIKKYLSNFDANINYFTLSDVIYPALDILDTLSYSYFSKIPYFISSRNSDQILLVTDGIPTSGLDLNSINFLKKIPINILGVGDVKLKQDIEITQILVPTQIRSGDVVDLKIRIKANVDSDITSRLQITNKNKKLIHNSLVSFKKGPQLQKLDISILASDLAGSNIAKILPLEYESIFKNNNYIFSVDVESLSKSVLLISGSLSSNTSFIKSSINNIKDIDILHHYRVDKNIWNEVINLSLQGDHVAIVLDDFPIYSEDRLLFESIIMDSKIKNIPIIYLAGPNCNLSAGQIVSSNFNSFNFNEIDEDIMTEISLEKISPYFSDINFNEFPPQFRTIKWNSTKGADLVFNDGSILAAGDDHFYIVSLPSIMGTHLKMRNNETSTVFKMLSKILINKLYAKNGLITLNLNDNVFFRGEILDVQLSPVENLGISEFYLETISTSNDTILTKCGFEYFDDFYHCTPVLKDSGNLKISGIGLSSDGKKVRGDEKIIFVQDVNIEMLNLIQDDISLKQIAYKTDGLYMHLDSLDAMLSSIQINPLKLLKKYQFTTLKMQNYWWLLILFLSFEWFIRKKLGLL